MTKYLLSIDPGQSSGISQFTYGDNTVPVPEGTWQVTGGLQGFLRWWDDEAPYFGTLLVEKFTARGNQGFSMRTNALEPLRIEGAIEALTFARGEPSIVEYAAPVQQYVFGGKGKAEGKKRQHRALRDLGYYVTGKDVGCADADDVRSSMAHALSYLMRQGHKPSYDLVSAWVEANQ